MNRIISFLLISMLSSCAIKPEKRESIAILKDVEDSVNTKKEVIDPAFANYLEQIQEISLPYSTACDNAYPDYPHTSKEQNLKYSKQELYYPFRKFPAIGGYQSILFLAAADIEIPIIYTFDHRGDTISTKQMFFGYCGGDLGYFHKEHFKIDEQHHIIHYDSTWRFKVDSLDHEVKGTRTLNVELTNYRITSEGIILKE